MNETIKTLIFDLDNTLIDRNQAMQGAIGDWLLLQGGDETTRQAALTEIMQKDDWGYADRKDFLGWLQTAYGRPNGHVITSDELLGTLLKNIIPHIQPNPAVNTMLQGISGAYRLVLATNGGSITQRAKVQQAQLLPFFQPGDVFVSGEMGVEKPDPQFFQQIIDRLQLDPHTTMSIGDNPFNDIQAAEACGLQTCWVSYGRTPVASIVSNQTINHVTDISTWRKA